MINKIIHFSIQNKFAIAFFTLVLILYGIYSVSRLPVDAVPDITNNQVQVITLASTLGAQEVEQFITVPIELSLASIPDVIEKRSISRSGLSVITIVFHDNTDIYWARQQISERLKDAQSHIPEGLADPELAPITTGLGEIYHYVVYAKPGFEEKYSGSDLRTIQDWIIRPQLASVTGVADISAWGGYLKTYEVSVDNARLKAMNVTIPEVFNALEDNNENTGGSYIEQYDNRYFIRGIGQVKSLEEIGNIAIKNANGIPILIHNVAAVQYSSATRYGAVTRDGLGEVVGGVVLMLKGENFNEVSSNVKGRIGQIQKSLPKGVTLEPYIDRSELVDRAMSTVERNLLEGALIVIFILVLFLGNVRAGLIVASVIPLAMLFAVIMMNLFGVSGNLMSLGAIDFGLIVDGAVIIVEAILYRIANIKIETDEHSGLHTEKYLTNPSLTKEQMSNEVYHAASRMMNSATFGQIIILIVYIPILTLIGVEGKMFRPMGMTVLFAITGALLLSLTYVPMMSALFLPKKTEHKRNISDRMMDVFQRLYHPIIEFAVRRKAIVIIVSLALLAGAFLLFSTMGSEFIPTLEEGDLTAEIFLPQGSSLAKSIEISTKAEKILKETFPEIRHAVTRIGSGEIPTDPMPIEQDEIMLGMKPMDEWTSAHSRVEMIEKIEEALSVIPGMFIEVTQPMQMRFNELMTGIKQDVAVKIYGDDLDTLVQKANEIAGVISKVNGVTEPNIERVDGLPQLVIEYDRGKLAQNGLSVKEVNRIISTAYAGSSAGVVYEGEKRFDLIVRLNPVSRADINDIGALIVPLPNGTRTELRQLATIQLKEAPAQISREDGKRRIYVGFNVHGRDVKSVVDEIQIKLDENVKLPPGYYFTYGGTFQNLVEANKRLSVALPVALILIFLLLYISFNSTREALLIYSAIPMSAIGGVIALWWRDMPFSISAGVGFIALFGVAVLNGIVLVSTFNQLEKDGITDIKERVIKGTKMRLRPVLMTASVASLGFLPMAISTSAGAEVQRPLATVVIGGLITATALTLIVLPSLYIIFSRKIKMKRTTILTTMIALLICYATVSNAQTVRRIPLSEAVQNAFQNNLRLHTNKLEIDKANILRGTSFNLPKTGIFIENEDFSPSDKSGVWKIGLSQSLEMPGVYKARKKFFDQQLHLTESQVAITQAELKQEVWSAYYQIWYIEEKQQLFLTLDSLYTSLYDAVSLRVKTGESAGLEKIAADARMQEVRMQIRQFDNDISIGQQSLMRSLNTSELYLPERKTLEKIIVDSAIFNVTSHPLLLRQQQQLSLSEAEINIQRKALLPDFSGRVFSQKLYGVTSPVSGFSLSVGVPIVGKSFKKGIEAARAENTLQQSFLQLETQTLQIASTQARQNLKRSEEALRYYEDTGLRQANDIIKASTQAFRTGEISFSELSQFLTQANDIRQNYLNALNDYNQAAIQLNYFLN